MSVDLRDRSPRLLHVSALLFASFLVSAAPGCDDGSATRDEDVDSVTPPGFDAAAPHDAGATSADSGVDAGGAFQDAAIGVDSATTTDAAVGPDATTGQDAAVDAGPIVHLKPRCMKKDSQLIVIGDSYINWTSHTFPADIKAASGQSWRMEAVGGTSLGSGGIGSIPQQFFDSIARDPDAHTILMDGGGNDILIPDITRALPLECTSKGASKKANCQGIVAKALETADSLLGKASSAGIRDVVYFFYPHVPANTILSGDSPDEILDYALPMVRDFCGSVESKTAGKTRCTFIDLVPLFTGHKDWFNEDIHENSKGSKAMAAEIWRVMSAQCIGQKGPKDCCE